MRAGAEYFLHPAGSSQRRYEALRSYFTQDMPAAEVADRFGYSTASVHQMATLLRTGRLNLFTDPKPGPKGPRKATGELRARVLALRAAGHSVTEIAAALTAGGLPVSAQTTWQILDAEGIGRLPRRDEGRRGPPARLDVVKAAGLRGWPAGPVSLPCHHAGLLLLFPAMAELGLPRLVRAAGYPSTRQLSSWQSVGSLLLAKCARTARIYHAGSLGDDAGLAFTLGLTALPKATHLGTYSWRARRECNRKLLSGLVAALRPLGLATGEAGFNCDFHAIRHHGTEAVLEKHYVPRRSQRTRAVLTFFAQDHASAEMVYANADITKASQNREVIAFCDHWKQVSGSDPKMLIMDQRVTTQPILGELDDRGVKFATLRMRSPSLVRQISALTPADFKQITLDRSGRHNKPKVAESAGVKLTSYPGTVRQLVVTGLGREAATIIITNDYQITTRALIERYARRMTIEQRLAEIIQAFCADALSSAVNLNVDLDVVLCVMAQALTAAFRLRLPGNYDHATPDTLQRRFLDTPGEIISNNGRITVKINRRAYSPVLRKADLPADTTVPWWDNRTLHWEFT